MPSSVTIFYVQDGHSPVDDELVMGKDGRIRATLRYRIATYFEPGIVGLFGT